MKLIALFALCAGCVANTEPPSHVVDDTGRTPGTCADPEGPARAYADPTEIEPLFVGRWLHCTGPTLTNKDDEAGVELLVDGTFYILQQNGDAIVREPGFAGAGTWEVLPETKQLNLTLSGGTWINLAPAFEDTPRRFQVLPIYKTPAVYVLTAL